MKICIENNKQRFFTAAVGLGSTGVAAAPVLISYHLKPEEFVNFVTQHIGAAISIGAVALLAIAVMMWLAYRHYQAKEDFESYQSTAPNDPRTKIDEDEIPYYVRQEDSTRSMALTPTGSSLNTYNGSFY